METIFRNYVVAVPHDTGTITIQTTATSPEAAKAPVENAEGCPPSALQYVREVVGTQISKR